MFYKSVFNRKVRKLVKLIKGTERIVQYFNFLLYSTFIIASLLNDLGPEQTD